MNKDVVLDFWRHARRRRADRGRHGPRRAAAAPRGAGRPALHRATSSSSTRRFPCLFRVEDVAVPFASSLTLKADKQPGARSSRSSMRSSPRAVHLHGRHGRPARRFQQGWAPQAQGPAAGAVRHRAPTSRARSSRRSPRATSRASRRRRQSAKPARVFVLASSQFLANPLARAGNGPGHGPVRHDDAEPRRRRAAAHARRALRAAVRHRAPSSSSRTRSTG